MEKVFYCDECGIEMDEDCDVCEECSFIDDKEDYGEDE